MFCSKCGKEISDDSKFCYSCGSKVDIKKKSDTITDTPPFVVNKETHTEIKNIKQTNSGKESEQVVSSLSLSKNEQETSITSDDMVVYYFKRFKIAVILFYLEFGFIIFGGVISQMNTTLGQFIMGISALIWLVVIGFIWYYMRYCSRLVGKSFLLYLLVSCIFSLLGPWIVYYLLKKSISPQFDIRKLN